MTSLAIPPSKFPSDPASSRFYPLPFSSPFSRRPSTSKSSGRVGAQAVVGALSKINGHHFFFFVPIVPLGMLAPHNKLTPHLYAHRVGFLRSRPWYSPTWLYPSSPLGGGKVPSITVAYPSWTNDPETRPPSPRQPAAYSCTRL